MFCKIFCYYENNDLVEVYDILKKEKELFVVYSDNYTVNNFLKSRGIKSTTFDEFFPFTAKLTFDIYKKTKDQIITYNDTCKNIQFQGFKIENGLQHFITNEILLLEKIRHILQTKKNVVFIFEKFSQTFFSILDLASSMGYEINKQKKISVIKNKKLHQLEPAGNHSLFERANKIAKYRSFYKIYSKNISSSHNKFNTILKISPKIFNLVLELLLTKFYGKFPRNYKKHILRKIDKKISDFDAEYGFFLSGGREDIIDSYISIINKFVNSKIKFKIFTIDSLTSSLLVKNKLEFLGLFEEVFAFENYLKKTDEGKDFDSRLGSIAEKNNLSVLFTGKLNQNIKDGIYRSISTSIIFDYIFQKSKFKAIVIIDGDMFGNVISSLAKKHHIPSVSIEQLLIGDNYLLSIFYKADKICIYGQQGSDALKTLGFTNDRIEITGNPKYDYISSIDENKTKKILEQKYEIDVTKKIIVIAMSRWHDGDEKWIPEFVRFCNKNKFTLVIKLHPRYEKNIEGSDDKIRTIRDRCKGLNYNLTFDIKLKHLLSGANLVICDNSSVCVDVMLLKKPLITINFVKASLEKGLWCDEFAGTFHTENYIELEKLVTKILSNEEYIEQLQKDQSKVIDMYNYCNDGMSTKRIFELILQISKKEN